VASIVRTRGSIGASAVTPTQFVLLYAAMLVAAAGNTALQSVMPAIGRQIGVADVWVALAYTWSALLWVLLASFWAEKSDRHGRKALTVMGVSGFLASMLLCGLVLFAGLHQWIGGTLTFALFALFRAIYGGLGCATPSATQAYLASKTRRRAGSPRFRRCRRRSGSGRSSVLPSRHCSCFRSSGLPAPCSLSR
jgi:MFS family permease